MDLNSLPVSRLILIRMVATRMGLGSMLLRIPRGFDWLAKEVSNSWDPMVLDSETLVVPVEPEISRVALDIKAIPEAKILGNKESVNETLSVVATLNLHSGEPLSQIEVEWLIALVGTGLWIRGLKIRDVYNGDQR